MAKHTRTKHFSLGHLPRYLLAIGMSVSMVGCADVGTDDAREEGVILDQGEDSTGVEELSMPLTSLATPCSYDDDTKTATVALASGEIGVASKRAIDSALLVNGDACGASKTTTLKKIVVTGAAGDETFILDYINGDFGKGSSSDVGVAINLGGGTGDAFKIRGKTGSDNISFGDAGASINTDSNLDVSLTGVEDVTVSLGAGSDKFTAAGGKGSGDAAYAGDLVVYGGDGADDIVGGDGDDTLSGGPGDDTIAGAEGDDTLNGNEGDDTFDEGAAANGDDVFNGDAGSDVVDYGGRSANLTVTMATGADDGDGGAGEADDVTSTVEGVNGGSGDDGITGSASADIIRGGAGDDTIADGAGDDEVYGDAGNDTFLSGTSSNGADVFNGGTGDDVVNYGSRTNDLVIDIDNSADDGEASENDNLKTDIENVVGGDGDDTITGSAFDNVLTGGDGDDVLNGGAGDDTFYEDTADSGSDTFNGGAGTDAVNYSSRTGDLLVTMDGVAADDGESGEGDDVKGDVEELLCGSGDDDITGNDADNYLQGGAGDDTLSGGAGNDVLDGGDDDDDLYGDAGDDLLDGGADSNSLDCGAGQGDIAMESGGTDCEL